MENLIDTPATTRSTGAVAGPSVHPVVTSDGTEVRLTHHAAGTKGPVVLAPGYGNKAKAFALDTVETNFADYLAGHGFDVWLFDYRSSPALESARTQFTVDDIATRDWPAAIATVRRETGAQSVEALAHCVGGLSLFMALGAGLEGVRSVVFSALAGHPIPTRGNRARSWVRLATAFKAVGIDNLTTDYDPSLKLDRAVDVAMKVFPFDNCDDPVCRRIYFVYGDVYDHANLNEATHAALSDVFGMTNLTFFQHISRMIRARRAVTADGEDAYLTDLEPYRIPIAFVTGEHNRMFLPESVATTYGLLTKAHGPELYTHHVVPGYAHLDCWLGEHSERDVFPIALAELEKHA